MKKILLILIFVFGIQLSYSQTVNDVPLSELDTEYVQIVGTSKMLSKKITIEIDFGQQSKAFSISKKTTKVLDENGKPMSFNSMIDALNFMSKNGYEFVDAYTLTVSGQNVYYYLLRKSNRQ